MWLLMCAIAFGGPLLVVGAEILLLIPLYSSTPAAANGVSIVTFSLLTVISIAVAGTGAVFRWCFNRAPTRGSGLLAGLVVALFFLSHDTSLSFIGRAITGGNVKQVGPEVVFRLLIESGTLIGLAIAISCVLILILELPLRWSEAGYRLVPEGGYRALRWIGFVFFTFLTSTIVREEGAIRLARAIQVAIN
jgi:hypothetical protein